MHVCVCVCAFVCMHVYMSVYTIDIKKLSLYRWCIHVYKFTLQTNPFITKPIYTVYHRGLAENHGRRMYSFGVCLVLRY